MEEELLKLVEKYKEEMEVDDTTGTKDEEEQRLINRGEVCGRSARMKKRSLGNGLYEGRYIALFSLPPSWSIVLAR